VEHSPLIEELVRRGYEVVMGVDSIDEYTLATLERYDAKYTLRNVAKDDFKLPFESTADAKEEQKEMDAEFAPLISWFKTRTPVNMDRIIVTTRLTTSPCAIAAAGNYALSANMERIAKAQALQSGQENTMGQMIYKKVLEINPRHPLIVELLARVKADPEDSAANDIAGLLIDSALLHSGYSVKDNRVFADRVTRMLQTSLGLDANADVKLAPLPEEPEPAAADSDDAAKVDSGDKAEL